MALCSTAVLLGTALLLLAHGGTQVLGGPVGEDADMELDEVKEILLGRRAVEPPEQGSPQVQVGPPQVQVGPEEDRDYLYHSVAEAEAEEPADLGKPLVLSMEVQNGPEKDRDHLYHG